MSCVLTALAQDEGKMKMHTDVSSGKMAQISGQLQPMETVSLMVFRLNHR